MATRKELQEQLDLLNKIEAKYKEISDADYESPFEGKSIAQLIDQYGTLEKAGKAINNQYKITDSYLKNITTGLSDYVRLLDAIKDEFSASNAALSKVQRGYNRIRGIASELQDIQADITSYTAKDIKKLKERNDKEFRRLKYAQASVEAEKNALEIQIQKDKAAGKDVKKAEEKLDKLKAASAAAADEVQAQEEANKAFERTTTLVDNVNSGLGISGKLVKSVGKLAGKLGIENFDESVNSALGDMKDLSFTLSKGGEQAVGFNGKLKVLQTGFSSLGQSLISSLKDPLVVIGLLTAAMKKLVDMGMHLSQEITDIGRSFNVSREAAKGLFKEIKNSAAASNSLLGTTKDMIAAQANINEQLGTRVMLSTEELETQVALTKVAGLNNEQAAELYKYSLLTGESSESIYDSIQAQGEGLLNNNQILKEVLEVEGQLAAQYKNDPKLIAQAVRQVKKLGINLQQAQNISRSMLDFESSIEAELEAQLLTGKQMNLSRVRELSLQGKTAEAASLALKQAGSLTEFQNMNVIAQESLASAMGLSTDELAKSLAEQERINILMAQNPGLDRQQATLQAQRENMSASEKLNASMAKFGDAIAKVVSGPVTFLVDGFASMVEGVAKIPGLAKILGGGTLVLGALALFTKGIPAIFGYFKKQLTKPGGGPGSDAINTKLDPTQVDQIAKAVSGGPGGTGGAGSTGTGRRSPGKASQTGMTKSGRPDMRTKAGRQMASQQKMRGGGMMAKMGGAGGAIMSGLGMAAQAAPIAASMFGRNLEAEGAEAGNRSKETIGSSMAQAGDVGVAKQATGFLSGLTGKAGALLSKLSPGEAVKTTLGKFSPKIFKALPNIAKRIPVLGAAIEGIFARGDIKEMIASGMPADDVYQNIGRRSLQALGGILGGGGAALAIQAANIVPGLGVILTPLAGLAGDFIGRSLGGLLADASPGLSQSVGKGVSSIFKGGSEIESRDKIQNKAGEVAQAKGIKTPDVKLATGGIVSQPTTALVGEAGPEAVMPLDALYRKFDQLIEAVNKGGSVYIDGNKAGEALVMGTYKSA